MFSGTDESGSFSASSGREGFVPLNCKEDEDLVLKLRIVERLRSRNFLVLMTYYVI